MKVFATQAGAVILILEEGDGIVEVSLSRNVNGFAFTPEMAARVGSSLLESSVVANQKAAVQKSADEEALP